MLATPALVKQRQEKGKFQASLDYMARLSQKTQKATWRTVPQLAFVLQVLSFSPNTLCSLSTSSTYFRHGPLYSKMVLNSKSFLLPLPSAPPGSLYSVLGNQAQSTPHARPTHYLLSYTPIPISSFLIEAGT